MSVSEYRGAAFTRGRAPRLGPRRLAAAVLLALLALSAGLSARGLGSDSISLAASDAVRPYQPAEILLEVPLDGTLSLAVKSGSEEIPVIKGLSVKKGPLSLPFTGLSALGEPLPAGQAVLTAALQTGEGLLLGEKALRVQQPAAGLAYVILSSLEPTASGGDDLFADYQLSRAGRLVVKLYSTDAPDAPLRSWSIQQKDALPHRFRWDRTISGKPAPSGDYLLTFEAQGSAQGLLERRFSLREGHRERLEVTQTAHGAFLPENLSDKAVWEAMMAPLAVLDIGDLQHQAIYEQPRARSAALGLAHGQTAGLMVLETGVSGFAKVRAARHGDGSFVTGYVPMEKLKMLVPDGRYGLLIDKGAQTLTIYEAGKALSTLRVSTGVYEPPGTDSFDTLAGAFFTQDRIAEFASEGYRYQYAVRIDGGNLIHSAGYRLSDGVRSFLDHQGELGFKASHGCVRVHNRQNAQGYNAWWLYANLPRNTKVLVLPEEHGLTPDARLANFTEVPAQAQETGVPGGVARTPAPDGEAEPAPASGAAQGAAAEETQNQDEAPAPAEGAAPHFQVSMADGNGSEGNQVEIVLSFGGDCILGSEERTRRKPESFNSKVEQEGYAWPFSGLQDIFLEDDLSMVNLENVLKDSAGGSVPRIHNFRGPAAYTSILVSGGVDLVNLANNHFVDYGQEGKNSTRQALRAAGIPYSGYGSLHVFEKGGIKIGFGGIRETIYHQNRGLIKDEIEALKAQGCHYIAYICHFGNEYEQGHNALQAQMAHEAIDAGADLVIGHHPHVVQGIEEYKGGLIFYSLGNLVFGGNLELTTFDGLIAQVRLRFAGEKLQQADARLIPVITSGARPQNDFKPVIAAGEDKARILHTINQDSEKTFGEEFPVNIREPAALSP